MILISYDISNDKLRTKFSKYIRKYGPRIQYSVYEIDNSPRILDNIISEINHRFMPLFEETDSILIIVWQTGVLIKIKNKLCWNYLENY